MTKFHTLIENKTKVTVVTKATPVIVHEGELLGHCETGIQILTEHEEIFLPWSGITEIAWDRTPEE